MLDQTTDRSNHPKSSLHCLSSEGSLQVRMIVMHSGARISCASYAFYTSSHKSCGRCPFITKLAPKRRGPHYKIKNLAVSRSLPIKDQASLESEDMFEDMILTSITLQKQIQSPKGLNLDFPKPFNRTMDWLQKDSKVAIEIFGRPVLPQQVRVRAYRSVSDTLLAL